MFLFTPFTHSPCLNRVNFVSLQLTQELKYKSKPSHSLLAADKTNNIGNVMRCEDFGDLQKLLRITAYALRAVEQFKLKKSLRANLANTLSPQEISAAELLWVTHIQRDMVQQKDYSMLKRQLVLFCDEKGVWRCGRRLQNADIH